VQSYFLEREVRRVDPTHSDVRIENRFYKVDLKWRGLKVFVQYDSFRSDDNPHDEVSLFNEQDIFIGIAPRYHRERNAHGAATPVSQALPDRSPVIDAYLAEHQKLKRSEYTDIVNRISVRYQLRPLTKDQTRRYIDFQMSEHGGDVKSFDDGTKDLIHEFTGGNPRSINNAAVACLMGATSKRQLRIDEEMFRSVSSELVLH